MTAKAAEIPRKETPATVAANPRDRAVGSATVDRSTATASKAVKPDREPNSAPEAVIPRAKASLKEWPRPDRNIEAIDARREITPSSEGKIVLLTAAKADRREIIPTLEAKADQRETTPNSEGKNALLTAAKADRKEIIPMPEVKVDLQAVATAALEAKAAMTDRKDRAAIRARRKASPRAASSMVRKRPLLPAATSSKLLLQPPAVRKNVSAK